MRLDKLIANIPKSETYDVSFEVSNDYKYLILYGNKALYAANIESLEEDVLFKLIFKISHDISYVSIFRSSGIKWKLINFYHKDKLTELKWQ